MLHRLSSTTALSACVLGSLLFSGVAGANDPEHYFYPKNKWVVERSEGAENNALRSCTIRNTLNNGYSVQIAGTSNGFTNINLDLKQNIFEAGKRYEVVYQVPGVKKELLPTRAFQKNLLVSDLRDKTEFVQAMRESGVLDIRIHENEFRIYMTGFDAKMQSFSHCVGESLNVAEAPGLRGKPKNSSSSAHRATTAFKAPRGSASERPEQRARYTEQLEAEIKQDNQLDDRSSETLKTEDSEKAMQVEAAVAKKPFYEPNISKHSANVDFTQPAEQDTARALNTIRPATGSSKTGAVQDDYSRLQADLSELHNEIKYLRNQNKALDEELKTVLSEGKVEKISVATDNWNLERATMRFEEAERQSLRLGRQLSSERARCELEKKDLETMLFDPQLTNQGQLAKLSSLEKSLEQSQLELNRQQRRYEERIKLLEDQLNAQ